MNWCSTVGRDGSRSPRETPLPLSAQVGEDCAGAVQFATSERVDAYLGADAEGADAAVEWLDESGVAERLRLLRSDHAAWRAARDTGQFSLAGAQPKTAFLFEDGRWGVPSGRTPTTHILKPPTGELDGHVENEHFCLALARRVGLPAASSKIMRFEDQTAIVIERYDRRRLARSVVRVHQEDMCQALAVPPMRKYENEGGPGARAAIELLRAHSGARDDDIATFADALAFNWLIAGTDAHAKNYSILIGAAGRARLAPLYDLASALPYEDMSPHKLKLAMRVGQEYRLQNIGVRDWRRFAAEARLDPDIVLARLADMAATVAAEAIPLGDEVRDMGLGHPIIPRLAERIAVRAAACAKIIGD